MPTGADGHDKPMSVEGVFQIDGDFGNEFVAPEYTSISEKIEVNGLSSLNDDGFGT